MHIGIVGAGNVSIGIADALAYLGIGKKITIYNRHIDKTLGEVWDLNDSIPLLDGTQEFKATNSYEDLKTCEVVAVCAGAKQKPNQTRLELIDQNYKIIKDIIFNLDRVNKEAKIIIVTNPVDILTRVAIRYSNREKNHIFGSGTVLDSIRLREAIGENIKINRKNIHAYIIGEHGDSEFPLWSACKIGPLPLESFNIDKNFKDEIAKQVRERAYKIIQKKNFTKQAIGTSVAYLIKSILYDERSIFTVSVPIENICGCIKKDVCLSLPCIIGKNGIEKKLSIKCKDKEFEKLKISANKLEEAYKKIGD